MTIKSVVASSPQGGVKNTTNATTNVADADGKQLPSTGKAAVYEKSEVVTTSTKTYTKDTLTLSEISKQVEAKYALLRETVENFVSMQRVKSGEAQGLSYDDIMEKYDGKLKSFYQSLKVDDATRSQAQEDISENGFWGVKQTSERAIAFAKALSGGDPSKVALLKNSIEEGYKAAEKAWGGKLPELCRQTQEATLRGLDEWAQEASDFSFDKP